jgi:hypothetical protein
MSFVFVLMFVNIIYIDKVNMVIVELVIYNYGYG